MWQCPPLTACFYYIHNCFHKISFMIFAFVSRRKEMFYLLPLLICQVTWIIRPFIFVFHIFIISYFFYENKYLNMSRMIGAVLSSISYVLSSFTRYPSGGVPPRCLHSLAHSRSAALVFFDRVLEKSSATAALTVIRSLLDSVAVSVPSVIR